jgi:hypothetical protein
VKDDVESTLMRVKPRRQPRRSIPKWVRELRGKSITTQNLALLQAFNEYKKYLAAAKAERRLLKRIRELQASVKPIAGVTEKQPARRLTPDHWKKYDDLTYVGIDATTAEIAAVDAAREWIVIDLLWFGDWLIEAERKRTSRRGPPPDPGVKFTSKVIAAYSLLQELEHGSVESAVSATQQLFHVSRVTVTNARKRWGSQLRKLGYGQVPAERKARIKMIEESCSDPRLVESK